MSTEYKENGLYAADTLLQLYHGPLNRIEYRNILLSSSEPHINDAYDPNRELVPHFATVYWPGGSPEHGDELETVALTITPEPSDTAAEMTIVRRSILGASIGQAAMDRIPAELQERWSGARERPGDIVNHIIEGMFNIGRRPLAICRTSDVVGSDPIMRTMHLYYPRTIPPEVSLAALQRSMQRLIDREQQLDTA
ncbi:MAG TPA: hypothetical protein VF733_06915 [Candidatus Saccharimonadales bacterium]